MADLKDRAHTLWVDLGASTALADFKVRLPLNVALHGVNVVMLVGYSATNCNNRRVRVRLLGTGLHPNETAVASLAGQHPADGIYFLAGGTQTEHWGSAVPVLYDSGSRQVSIEHLTVEVTDWAGGAITYDNLMLEFVFTKKPPLHVEATDAVMHAGINTLRFGLRA